LKDERRARIQIHKDFADMQKSPTTVRKEYERSHPKKDVGEC
jgi:hypothetical protein